MSYLEPRAGQTSGDDTSVPAPRPQHLGDIMPEPEREPEPAKRGPGRRRAGKNGKRDGGRAGRNLPAAIAVGVSLVLLVLASLLIWPPAFPGLIAVAAGAGVWEMTRALKASGAQPPLIPLLGGALLMVGLAWHDGPDSLLVGLAVTVVASLLWRLADGPKAVRRDFTSTLMIAVYVPFLLSFAVLLQLPDADTDGRWRILCTLFAVVLSDTGGYAAGVFLGKHKMAPSISPGKTWEGFAGSICASAIGSALLLYFLLDIPSYWGLLFGAVLSVVAVVGDLAESMLKRDLGLKDMSHLLPGHGGIMDRLDSILFAVPTAYLLFAVIAHQL
ncbi:phosphatidate cytidylyltransferase [Actinoplanes sp. NPDC051513]|uniref:phosphatidate cytidylyltransferase n=1 Tax=Actinoplanes sp. NPDC051513 TaxID=3363908 RepID=UPI00379DCA56